MLKRAIAHTFDEHWKLSPSGCWEWQRNRDKQGYGRMRNGAHRVCSHRFSFERANGPIPPGMMVLHRCDNPSCVNPDHLFLGDDETNKRDMYGKTRHAHGERHGNSKLTAEKVIAIRQAAQSGVRHADIAASLSISVYTVRSITCGRAWRHV